MATMFRETMWFKLGAEPEGDSGDGDEGQPSATRCMLPVEDRYDGQVSAEDTATFGLHTGTTEYLRVIEESGGEDVDVAVLVREMKDRRRSFLAIGAGVAAAFAMIAIYLA